MQQRIFTAKVLSPISASIGAAALCPRGAILGWRFARQLFEYAIELRQRLKTDRECDFAYAKIDIVQKNKRLFKSGAGNVVDKVNASHLLELLTQMIPADVDRPCHFRQRKLFIRVFVDEIARPPDFDRFRLIAFSAEALRRLSRIPHIHN